MRVLLAEDDSSLTAAVRRGLAEQGYAVDAVSDGQRALEDALGAGYDVLILDIMLPGLDGTSVCRRLRAAGDATPVLMLTARASVDDRVAGLDSGADDYLAKPFTFRELLAAGHVLLGTPSLAVLCVAGG